MKPPHHDGRGKNQVNRARRPDEVEEYDRETGRTWLVKAPKDPNAEPDNDALSMRERKRRTQQALAMFSAGEEILDIAAHFNVVPSTVVSWFQRHRRAVNIADIDRQLDTLAVPLAADNLIHGLLAGDKDYTLKTLEGRGHLRKFTAGEQVVKHEMPPLVIRFEGAPETVQMVPSATGKVVGQVQLPPAPKTIDGTVVRSEPVGVGVPALASTE